MELTRNHLHLDESGCVSAPTASGLGMELDLEAVRPYLLDVEITVAGKTLYRTPDLVD